MEILPEILLIDKPKGITSYDVIRRLKPTFPRGTKLGHAGTLDPLASGLMIIGVGRGTKRLTEFLKLPKTYLAEVLLGVRTTTGDLEGEALEVAPVGQIEGSRIEIALADMTGELHLAVPRYSAVKVGGRALYKRARAGDKSVTPPVKPMLVKTAKLIAIAAHTDGLLLTIEFDVGSGTYIRSLAEELGRRLGLPATLANLCRTSIGMYPLEDADKI